ncbi:TPA: helix-turn-helix domain-containing protein [Klebsiella pneumoniae]|nr:helix-turn-helix domain-containing protein [Klebsiella pneumoniae]
MLIQGPPVSCYRECKVLDSGATRQQVADVIGVGVKTIYKYLPAT